MTALGEAVRVHSRENQAREMYRVFRNIWLHRQRTLDPGADRAFLMAVAWRSRWTALAEIIEAEERRVAA